MSATTTAATLPAIQAIIASELGIEPAAVLPHLPLDGDDLGCDALDVAAILVAVETRWRIDIPEHEAPDHITVGALADLVAARTAP
jgi:acyl carrier protein